MPAIGQQSHRVEPPACGNFDHHHGRSDPCDEPRAAFGVVIATIELMTMRPAGQLFGMHGVAHFR